MDDLTNLHDISRTRSDIAIYNLFFLYNFNPGSSKRKESEGVN